MPIRINLLAEAQALEELRRRDPVKRAMWGGVLIVTAMLVWSGSLWAKSMIKKSELTSLEAGIKARSSEYDKILQNEKQLLKAKQNLTALQQLATERFLNGPVLNALQQTMTENIQLVRFQINQTFPVTPEVPVSTNDDRIIPGKPARIVEKKTLSLVAKDFSHVPGDAIPKYKEMVSNFPYFQTMLGKTNEIRLKDYSAPQMDTGGKTFVMFTLECRYPDKTR
jgi:hypothetical protein